MSLILNIDTALERASVCLANKSEVIQLSINPVQKNDATWLHTAIIDLMQKTGISFNALQAIAVSIGPGSYTGLRVGLSAAKGFCFALNIPLIAIGTLEIIAYAVKNEAIDLVCPLVDARRMEVFTAIYDKRIFEKKGPAAMIINADSFASLLADHSILFCGNGAGKLRNIIESKNASFSSPACNAAHMAELSYNRFIKNEFAGLAYTEPLYIKEFYSAARK